MNDEMISVMLEALKTDIGIRNTSAYDDRLIARIETAMERIKAEGVTTLDCTVRSDRELVVMYASWLWNQRKTHEGMGRMLRVTLNNRIFKDKAKG
jgi:hypothetical protein